MWWEKETKESDYEVGEVAQGTRWFSSQEKDRLLSYASNPPKPKMQIVETELVDSEVVDLALPESFNVNAMISVFDGVVGQVADADEAVSLVSAMLQAGKRGLARKVEAQRIEAQKLESAESQVDQLIQDGMVDLKLSALESRMLAERQTQASQRIQSKVDQVSSLGKPDSPSGSS
jgi:hypothetical protein